MWKKTLDQYNVSQGNHSGIEALLRDSKIRVPKTTPSASIPLASCGAYSLDRYISYDKFFFHHGAFLTSATSHIETKHYFHVVRKSNWLLLCLMKFLLGKTTTGGNVGLCSYALGKKAFKSNWVYKIKNHVDESIEWYRPLLMVLGNTQAKGRTSMKLLLP